MITAKRTLKLAGALSFALAIFQAAISLSIPVSRYFGAPEELLANSNLLIMAGLVIALVFALFGLYAFSGAGSIRRLPLLRLGLLGIGALYTLRGIFLIPEILMTLGYLQSPQPVPPQELVSSLVSLSVGVCYLAGTTGNWRNI